jgi:hypothetical protein
MTGILLTILASAIAYIIVSFVVILIATVFKSIKHKPNDGKYE